MLKCANADGSFVRFGIWSLDYEWRVPKGMMLLRCSHSVIQMCPDRVYTFFICLNMYMF